MVVVTGATSGIGEAAALELADRGERVVAVGRDPKRLERVHRRLGGDAPEPLRADFSSHDEIHRLAQDLLDRHERIDVLVNNAGVFMGRRELTADGHEMTFGVNHLAPFLLTNLLLDRLRASAPARVVTTSSDAHYRGRLDLDDLQGEREWSSWGAYSSSKLANVAFTRELARRLEGSGVTANCLHPGVIRTRLGRGASGPMGAGWALVRFFFRSPRRGSETVVHLAASPEVDGVSGEYFANCREKSAKRLDPGDERRLWELSEDLVGLRSHAEPNAR